MERPHFEDVVRERAHLGPMFFSPSHNTNWFLFSTPIQRVTYYLNEKLFRESFLRQRSAEWLERARPILGQMGENNGALRIHWLTSPSLLMRKLVVMWLKQALPGVLLEVGGVARCVAHDDCAELDELGRACWLGRYAHRYEDLDSGL